MATSIGKSTNCFAVALKYGRVRIQELQSCLNDIDVLTFADKIKIISDEKMNEKYPQERGARIEFVTSDNKQITESVNLPEGEYDTPLTDNKYLEKSKIILDGIVSQDFIYTLWDKIVVENKDTVKLNDCIEIFTTKI